MQDTGSAERRSIVDKTCEGCPFLGAEYAGRGYDFILCNLGKFDRPKGVFEHAPAEQGGRPSAPIPAWCKLGKGKKYC